MGSSLLGFLLLGSQAPAIQSAVSLDCGLVLTVVGIAVSLLTWALTPSVTARVVAVITAIGLLCYVVFWILPGPQSGLAVALKLVIAIPLAIGCGYVPLHQVRQGAKSLEESARNLEVAERQKSQAISVYSVTGQAQIALSARGHMQAIPSPGGFKRWGQLRIEAADMATNLLRFLIQQQRKAMNKSSWKARAIETMAVNRYKSHFNPRIKEIADELHGYGCRGNGFDAPYDRLDYLTKHGPGTFAEIREVATCISNILDNDGYAAFQIDASMPSS